MAIDRVDSAAIKDLSIATADIADGSVTAAKLASGAALSNLGFTPQTQIGTIVGIAKGNGANALNAATAGTDYSVPSGAETLSNKRITSRVGSTASSATPTINTDLYDVYKITALAVDITSMTTNLTGTPVDGDCLIIEITGTAARAIAWGAKFEASTVALPATTVTTTMLAVAFLWNTATNAWRCVGVA